MRSTESGDVTNPPSETSQLFRMIRQLARITTRLRLLGLVALSTTLLNIVVLVGGVIDIIVIRQYNRINSQDIVNGFTAARYFPYGWLLANVAIFFVSIVVLGLADVLRRRGDALFQEVSAAFQEIDRTQSSQSQPPDDLTTEARFGLRAFASAADLPLVRGRYGAAIYALLNIVVMLIAVILYSQLA